MILGLFDVLAGWSAARLRVVGVLLGAGLLVAVAASVLVLRSATVPEAAVVPQVPHFVDATASSGIDFTYTGDFDYSVGGGVAAFDCSGDGKPSLYFAGGSQPAALYRNDTFVGGPLHFTRLQSPVTDLTGVMGAYPIDLQGRGLTDLVVLRDGETVLLRGLGDCQFERANEDLHFDGTGPATTAFSATWQTGANLPTLAFGRYEDPASNDPHHLCFDNVLFRPAGATFGDPLPLRPAWCALSMLFSDWNRSGHMDLRVSNDEHYYLPTDGQEQLWRMTPGEPPHLYTADEGWNTVQIEGMGIASYDLTGSGYPDYFLTSQAANRLQTLTSGPAQPAFRDAGMARGINAAHPFAGDTTLPSTAWHAQFEDVNNDGLIDLFISKGNVTDQPDYARQDPSDLFVGQPDGRFDEAADTAGIVSFDRGRGAALVDLSLDGRVDIVQVNYGAPVRIWQNVGAGSPSQPTPLGNWLELRAAQDAPNVDAIGAWFEVRTGDRIQRRELTIGGGHASGQLGWTHFGLGRATTADVRVAWPGGEVGPWQPVTANGFGIVRRGATSVETWSPG
ncbi:MAG: CRTAC1 family protein [Chloroflexi bacterium]|nr:CRTAC1 family protein [Chloroflexota bacterium]